MSTNTIDYWEAMKAAQTYAKGKPFVMEVRKEMIYVRVGSNQRATCIGEAPKLKTDSRH